MKPFNLNLLILSFFIIFSSCQKEIKSDNPGTTPVSAINPTTVKGNLAGKVVDENNKAVSGATVKAGSNITTTDHRGLFRFDNIQLDKFATMVSVEKNGYFNGIRTFSATANSTNFVKLKLLPKTLSGNIDAATGGSVSLPDHSKISISAGSVIVKSTNQIYTGGIKIFTAVIDPTSADIAQIVPGSFQAINANSNRVTLKSFGMIAVKLEGSNGEALQIAAGKTARLRITIPSSLQSDAPATIPFWYLNETDGLWKQEGNAVKSGNYYDGDVSHFSFWNSDIDIPSVYLEFSLQTSKGFLPFTTVKITRINGGGSAYSNSDSAGHVSGLVPLNEKLKLEILNSCNQVIFQQNIGPFVQSKNIGAITISIPAGNTLQITGSVVDCNNQPVKNGAVNIYYEGILFTRSVVNGNFSTILTSCSYNNTVAEIAAVDFTGRQQGNKINFNTGNGIINTGSLSACGTSITEYINFTLDGVPYSLSSQNSSDSLLCFGVPTFPTLPDTFDFNISGLRSNSNPLVWIRFGFTGSTVGSFSSGRMFINQFTDGVNFYNDINITQWGAIGQFMEGDFSGTFIHWPANTTHTISCNFKVRRQF